MNKKSFLVNIFLLLFSTALSFLVLEQSYRLYLFKMDAFSFKKMNSMHDVGVSGLIKPSSHLEIIYELKQNLNSYFKLVSFRTNSRGLRDKEYGITKPRDTFRVAVIGDSYTMPAGVEIEEAYHTLLEEWLNKERRLINYQFVNFGVGGYSLRQYLGVIKDRAHGYDPDLIIVGFCPSNDHIVPAQEHFEHPYKVKPKTYPFFKSYVIDKVASKLNRLKRGLLKNDNNVGKIQSRKVFSEQQEGYMLDIFSKMKEFCKGNNMQLIIANLTHRYNERYSKALEELVIDRGLHFVDVSLPFKGANILEYTFNPTDGHPNGKANRIFAEQLYDYLNKKNLLNKKKDV